MSDDDRTWARWLLLALAAIFLVSVYFVLQEIRYAVAGRTAAATVDRVNDLGYRGTRRSPRRARVILVEYHFMDAAGSRRTGSFDIGPLALRPAPGSTLQVQYVGSSSRPLGQRTAGD